MQITFNPHRKHDFNDNGLNNAAVLTFSKDVLNSVIKEMTQNSIDALVNKGSLLKVKVNIDEVPIQEIANIEDLKKIISLMIEYWQEKQQENFLKYFHTALEKLDNPTIRIFKYEDFNTKGLLGGCESGPFKSLIFDEGVSEKDSKNSLGGFGIGKNALYALTNIGTVFYSTHMQVEW